jgi:hypothetical protein
MAASTLGVYRYERVRVGGPGRCRLADTSVVAWPLFRGVNKWLDTGAGDTSNTTWKSPDERGEVARCAVTPASEGDRTGEKRRSRN